MGLVDEPLPTTGESKHTAEADVRVLLAALKAEFNGGISLENLSPALQSQFGLTSRGKCIVATEQFTTSLSFTTLSTPDTVEGVVLPTDGLIFVAYQAMWKEASLSDAAAAIYLGSNQLKYATDQSASPGAQAANIAGDVNPGTYKPLASFPGGLASVDGNNAGDTAYAGDVTTGQVIGMYRASDTYNTAPYGVCTIFAAAGTYDVSVKFLSNSGGAVTVKNRKMWVWTEGFD